MTDLGTSKGPSAASIALVTQSLMVHDLAGKFHSRFTSVQANLRSYLAGVENWFPTNALASLEMSMLTTKILKPP